MNKKNLKKLITQTSRWDEDFGRYYSPTFPHLLERNSLWIIYFLRTSSMFFHCHLPMSTWKLTATSPRGHVVLFLACDLTRFSWGPRKKNLTAHLLDLKAYLWLSGFFVSFFSYLPSADSPMTSPRIRQKSSVTWGTERGEEFYQLLPLWGCCARL